MAALALTLDESCYINGLGFVPMDKPDTLGRRLIAAVVPRHFKDLNALHLATKIAYSTVHKWKTGESNPRWEQVETVAALVGINPFRLISAAEVPERRLRVGDHPQWSGAVVRAQQRFPNRVPERFDENFAFELAQFWFKHATDHDLKRADTAAAARELDELRASTKAQRP